MIALDAFALPVARVSVRDAYQQVYGAAFSEAHVLIADLAERCDVGESKYEEARQHYEAVGKWLSDDEGELGAFEPRVYAQGSTALGTLIKPPDGGTYDVDAVCVFRNPPLALNPQHLKRLVGDRLKAHATYARILDEEGRRCWTLRYSDASRFHLDVLPAIPRPGALVLPGLSAEIASKALRITDTHAPGRWLDSNPLGYVAWFEERRKLRRDVLENLRKAHDVIPLADYNADRYPLQRVVQLLKRHRDLMFGNDEDRPISIVLTTLAASAYDGEGSVLNALLGILPKIRDVFEQGDGRVVNPVNPSEVFTDKWLAKPRKRGQFMNWLGALDDLCREIRRASGIDALANLLARFFGDDRVDEAMEQYESRQVVPLSKALTATGGAAPLASPPRYRPHAHQPQWPSVNDHTATLTEIGLGRPRSRGERGPLRKGSPLDFHVETTVPAPYEVFWQVLNSGPEAARKRSLRGTLERARTEGEGGRNQRETAMYSGTHTIEAFVVKDGQLRARTGCFEVKVA